MNHKNVILVLLMAFLTPIAGFSLDNIEIRTLFETAFNANVDLDRSSDGSFEAEDFHFRDLSAPLAGVTFEVTFGKVGLGTTFLVGLDEMDEDFSVEFDNRYFVSWHFLGSAQTFDLWAELGFGIAGAFREPDDDWVDSDYDTYDFWYGMEFMDMALYSHAALGLALTPVPFLTLGARFSVRPFSSNIPSLGVIGDYDTPIFQAGLFAGLSIDIPMKKKSDSGKETSGERKDSADKDSADLAREKAADAERRLDQETANQGENGTP